MIRKKLFNTLIVNPVFLELVILKFGTNAINFITETNKNFNSFQIEWLMMCLNRQTNRRNRSRSDQYAYQIAEIQQKTYKRGSSLSSSENFSSSRSDSWRQNHHHHCGIPLRLLDPKRRANSWLVTRKTSQDSNLSSSRNDSSGSATTQSTSTWRMSRSSASSDVRTQIIPNADPYSAKNKTKPRLTRQSAVSDDSDFNTVPNSPGRLTVRFLTTIPSAAETSMQNEDDPCQEISPDQQKQAESTSNPLVNEVLQNPIPNENRTEQNKSQATPEQCESFLDGSGSSAHFKVPNLAAVSGGLPTIRSAPSLYTPEAPSSPVKSNDRQK